MKFTKTRSVKSPSRAHLFDAGLDFYIPDDMPWESINIPPAGSILIPAGIKIEVPPGTMLLCLEKSGIAQKGLIIGAKVVDCNYQGEIHIHLINTTTEYITIKAGQKIAQFILVPILTPQLEEVRHDLLFGFESSRGEGGFGSTGI